VGVAGVVNALSSSARAYFTAGGIGILIGDGRLPDYTTEKIVETYYSAQIAQSLAVTADYQFIANPAYAGGRGPVSILGARLAAQF
jgi:high affinity Mn2+ porin